MNPNTYQEENKQFATYPGKETKSEAELVYLTLGLVGESGEFADKIKKKIRDGTFDILALQQELGDVFWYLSRLAWYFDLTLSELAELNFKKLSDRKTRGVLKGSGDNR